MHVHQRFFLACARGDTAEAKKYISQGVPVDWQNPAGWSALHAGSVLHLKIVMLLLKNKCDVNITNKDGVTALMNAAQQNQMDIVRALVEAGCDITRRDNEGKNSVNWAKESKENTDAIVEYLTNEAPSVQVHSARRARAAP